MMAMEGEGGHHFGMYDVTKWNTLMATMVVASSGGWWHINNGKSTV